MNTVFRVNLVIVACSLVLSFDALCSSNSGAPDLGASNATCELYTSGREFYTTVLLNGKPSSWSQNFKSTVGLLRMYKQTLRCKAVAGECRITSSPSGGKSVLVYGNPAEGTGLYQVGPEYDSLTEVRLALKELTDIGACVEAQGALRASNSNDRPYIFPLPGDVTPAAPPVDTTPVEAVEPEASRGSNSAFQSEYKLAYPGCGVRPDGQELAEIKRQAMSGAQQCQDAMADCLNSVGRGQTCRVVGRPYLRFEGFDGDASCFVYAKSYGGQRHYDGDPAYFYTVSYGCLVQAVGGSSSQVKRKK